MTVAMGPWKKDPKTLVKKITHAFTFPMEVKAMTEEMPDFAKEVTDIKELQSAVNDAQAKVAEGTSKKVIVEPVSCDFTKENFAAKPDQSAPGADDVPEEEFCDNCGRVMVLRNGPVGSVHGLSGL